jgi:hypothetical protein
MAPRLTPDAAVLLIANLVDALLTLVLLQLRVACEVNPLLSCAYEASPLAFMIGKLSLVQLATLLVTLQPNESLRRVLLRSGAGLYGAVVAYQVLLFLSLIPTLF